MGVSSMTSGSGCVAVGVALPSVQAVNNRIKIVHITGTRFISSLLGKTYALWLAPLAGFQITCIIAQIVDKKILI
jgi:hypothetical protein